MNFSPIINEIVCMKMDLTGDNHIKEYSQS